MKLQTTFWKNVGIKTFVNNTSCHFERITNAISSDSEKFRFLDAKAPRNDRNSVISSKARNL